MDSSVKSMRRWRVEKITFKLIIGQQLLLSPWIFVLCDYHLDLVLRDSLYHLHGDAYVNLLEQSMNVIRSERFRIKMNLKVYVEPMAKSYWRRND